MTDKPLKAAPPTNTEKPTPSIAMLAMFTGVIESVPSIPRTIAPTPTKNCAPAADDTAECASPRASSVSPDRFHEFSVEIVDVSIFRMVSENHYRQIGIGSQLELAESGKRFVKISRQ